MKTANLHTKVDLNNGPRYMAPMFCGILVHWSFLSLCSPKVFAIAIGVRFKWRYGPTSNLPPRSCPLRERTKGGVTEPRWVFVKLMELFLPVCYSNMHPQVWGWIWWPWADALIVLWSTEQREFDSGARLLEIADSLQPNGHDRIRIRISVQFLVAHAVLSKTSKAVMCSRDRCVFCMYMCTGCSKKVSRF